MIRERRLSDIICGATTISELQLDVFAKSSQENPMIKCDSQQRAKLDFEAISQNIGELKKVVINHRNKPFFK